MAKSSHRKLLIISRPWAPQVGGSQILLANMLGDYKGDLIAIAGYSKDCRTDPTFKSPCKTIYLSIPNLIGFAYEGLRRRYPEIIRKTIQRSMTVNIGKVRPDVILAVYPYEDYLVSSFIAAKKSGIPFYVQMHDLWLDNMPDNSNRKSFAAKWEPVILNQAKRVLCMTEAMQSHYETKYRIKTELLPHCIPKSILMSASHRLQPPVSPRPTILFVGSVSDGMNLDALRVISRASEILPREYRIIFCTAHDSDALKLLGINIDRIDVGYYSRKEVRSMQEGANVLISPLSHKNGDMKEIQTVFSTKLLEYLTSGRPIVVFAPENSFHAISAKKNGWGYLVTKDSPEALAEAIIKVNEDQELASRLVEGAYREALSRDASIHASRLFNWVQSECL